MSHGGKNRNTSWGAVAASYAKDIRQDSSYQSTVILPNLLRLLDPKDGMRLIDIGCGDGFFSFAFAEAGADVVGVDIAPEMIARARASALKKTHFEIAAADALSFAKTGSFDAAVIVLALQNIENFSGALAEAGRILKRDGRLVIVLNHPAFRIPQVSSWGWDAQATLQYRRMDGYLSDRRVKIDMTPGKRIGKIYTYSFHRPLQSYVKALAKVGFVLDGLEEWISHKVSQIGPRAAAEDASRKEFPLFLALVARKTHGTDAPPML